MKTSPTTASAAEAAPKEFLLVTAVSFAGLVVTSLRMIMSGPLLKVPLPLDYLAGIVQMIASLVLLSYVWTRRGVRLSDRLADFRYRDVLVALGLSALALLAAATARWSAWVAYVRLSGTAPTLPRVTELLPQHLAFWPLAYTLTAVFFEELIGRVFVIDELTALTSRRYVGILGSVAIGASYHIYQGWLGSLGVAASFTVFSLYYVRARRVWPLILAHFFVDAVIWGRVITH